MLHKFGLFGFASEHNFDPASNVWQYYLNFIMRFAPGFLQIRHI